MIPVSGDSSYHTAPRTLSAFARRFPSLAFYRRWAGIVRAASRRARRGEYGDQEWYESSIAILRALESAGVEVQITGLDHLKALDSPCVLVGNHMSMLETFVLPGVIRPFMPVTFVVKEDLLTMPVFAPVMRSRDPVAVSRTNPRQDFAAVMKGGKERLDKGISIVVFPQTTRTATFDPASFNSIGTKLAKRAGVPVVPVAVLTDAWGNGKLLKDFGRIDVRKKVCLAFGEPIDAQAKDPPPNSAVVAFIEDRLAAWRA